jgi:hypothetical protein
MPHFLEPPFHLPDGRDARLVHHLQEDDWASAATLLSNVVGPQTTEWKWLVLLAYVRFRDATDVVPDELTAASRQALELLDRAMHHGAPLADVAPFREAVERTLDQLSRGEDALLGRLSSSGEPSALTDEELEHAAVVLGRTAPSRSAALFEHLALRQARSPLRVASSARAALAWVEAGQFDKAKPTLEAVLLEDWSKRPLADERLVVEAVETVLLEHLAGDEFVALWHLASERGQALAFPFPAAWPHQERLMNRLLTLRDYPRARALAQRIESERIEVSSALAERLELAKTGVVASA